MRLESVLLLQRIIGAILGLTVAQGLVVETVGENRCRLALTGTATTGTIVSVDGYDAVAEFTADEKPYTIQGRVRKGTTVGDKRPVLFQKDDPRVAQIGDRQVFFNFVSLA